MPANLREVRPAALPKLSWIPADRRLPRPPATVAAGETQNFVPGKMPAVAAPAMVIAPAEPHQTQQTDNVLVSILHEPSRLAAMRTGNARPRGTPFSAG